jgi:hypothetical protein
MKASTIIKSLFNWFADCEVLDADSSLNVEHLGEEPEQYSIEVVPCNKILKQYVDGSAKCQYLFIFASREHYGNDNQLNMSNLEFYEELEEWIAEQNINSHLPNLPEDCTPQSVKVLSSGYVEDNDTKTARYQIQCQLIYIKEATQ